ncbi:RsfA family transcriptional regulator [Peribacillus psychrosaccharolyticus]|uniref:RsfA family transcriptional regulator n=1 Tax=Peribacillus psychrosaccharolyticus TaxID=1407 RepID=A0A974NPM6_PERPY|nr:RsfA family transcriptional regulator [Peribacillus psychrosaccharolyticus]MEC2053687.1 RsfA family transcriptional regulator [Peribacillus psychrosaccharolyticus]MED3742698.1 RsfA family transcriptional regulator [Peribacillus psychrosaccharolyticus]QQT01637.1 RsfA family transcriptional regulator [Peribacillus psychrosaccharolyticus]
MSIARQDAWSQDEDVVLAEVVLRHIRDGSTQLKAFEEVGKRLARTSAACGFRWNSFVRQQYKSGIELAKKQRKGHKQHAVDHTTDIQETKLAAVEKNESRQGESITLEEIISFLSRINEHTAVNQEQNEKLLAEARVLSCENDKLQIENKHLLNQLTILEEDYRTLLSIMERARKLTVLEEEKNSPKVKFQMDKNGNLERVSK